MTKLQIFSTITKTTRDAARDMTCDPACAVYLGSRGSESGVILRGTQQIEETSQNLRWIKKMGD